MNAILEGRLEAGANAGDQNRISHEIKGLWLLNFIGYHLWRPPYAQAIRNSWRNFRRLPIRCFRVRPAPSWLNSEFVE
jgi:hypothetical protein